VNASAPVPSACGTHRLRRVDRIELGGALAVLAGTLALRPDAFQAVAFLLPFVAALVRRESPVGFAGPLVPKVALALAAVVLVLTLPLVGLGVALQLVEWRPSAPEGQALAGLAVAALVEEWLFRGYLQTRLERVLPPRTRILGTPLGAAWLLTALLFGLAHLPQHGPLEALARVAPGLVFGFCRARAGSIWPGWVVHVAYNVVGGMLAR